MTPQWMCWLPSFHENEEIQNIAPASAGKKNSDNESGCE